jgi:large subunit ribosomal protein L23
MAELNMYEVLRRPIFTEKSYWLAKNRRQYVFEVAANATKPMIKQAVEAIFDVEVEKVRVMKMPAKRTVRWRNRRTAVRKPGYKKAVVTLAPGETIDLFEGVK